MASVCEDFLSRSALLTFAALAGVAASAGQVQRVRGHAELHRTWDAGDSCTSVFDVDRHGCVATNVLDRSDWVESYSVTADCGETFTTCGMQLLCDCMEAWRDAGLLLPDGGRCGFQVLRLRDGGFEFHKDCPHSNVFEELKGAGGIVGP